MLSHKLKQHLEMLIKQGLHRHRQISAEGMLNFSSNDYLSLASDPNIKKAYQRGFERYACGSGGASLVCGYHNAHQSLEKAFTEALKVDDCVLFSSGYAANLSVIYLLATFNSHILLDKGIHASIYDGLNVTGVQYSRYLHNNLADLATKLQKLPKNTVVMTESIFSMSGQCAPLAEISRLGQQFQHELFVDEAHAFGLRGHQGLGAVVEHQLTQNEVPLRVIPLGKAYAASGAIVAGQKDWIDALLQSARPYIYSTALSPAIAYGLLETLDIIRAADDRRAKLVDLIAYFRGAIAGSPLQWRDSSSAIQQLQLNCPHRALDYAKKLRERSINCIAMRQPTVSKQETGLRILLNYHHQEEQIDHLLECLHQL